MKGLRRKFPGTFWTANSMELFERMAFYGMYSVLALYLTGKTSENALGFTDMQAGTMMAVFSFVLYFLPVLAGAVADRIGYRKTLAISFVMLSAAYLLSGQMESYPAMFAALLFIAVGGSLFKPTLSGTISKVTDETNGTLGFGIFYWVVNIGGFLGPFVAAYLRAIAWKWVFAASSAWVLLMLIPLFTLYKEPQKAVAASLKKSIVDVFVKLARVFANWRFMLFIVIFGGFWTVFFQLFFALPIYIQRFVDTKPALAVLQQGASFLGFSGLAADWAARLKAGEGIPPELIINIDAGCIILLQILVSRIVLTFKPVKTMIAGTLLFALSMGLLALSPSIWCVISAIVILAIGEMTASPKFLDYVGRIAPRDQVALYMGCAFVCMSIGDLLGGFLGGWCLNTFATGMNRPDLMWLFFSALAVLTALALLVYNVRLKPVKDEKR